MDQIKILATALMGFPGFDSVSDSDNEYEKYSRLFSALGLVVTPERCKEFCESRL